MIRKSPCFAPLELRRALAFASRTLVKALLARKVGMSHMFSPEGEAVPVTLLQAVPNEVVLRRSEGTDGYSAVQLGLARKNSKHKAGDTKLKPTEKKAHFEARQEFSLEVDDKAKTVDVTQFEAGDTVQVTGISKGKGYAGVVKRHNFKGGPASHGHRHVLRQAGSIGAAYPQHVFKGVRMAGRMGGDQVTVKNLTVAAVDAKEHLLAIKGAVPGKKGTVLSVVTTS